eukprot:6363751-Amphidinium_carterae.1
MIERSCELFTAPTSALQRWVSIDSLVWTTSSTIPPWYKAYTTMYNRENTKSVLWREIEETDLKSRKETKWQTEFLNFSNAPISLFRRWAEVILELEPFSRLFVMEELTGTT